MTKYHALIAYVRQMLRIDVDVSTSLELLDCTRGDLNVVWDVAQTLRTACPMLLQIHVSTLCRYGQVPLPPASWQGPWLRDLPGVQRLRDGATGMALSVWVHRSNLSECDLSASLLGRRALVLVDHFEGDWMSRLPVGSCLFNPHTQELQMLERHTYGHGQAPADSLASLWNPGRRLPTGAEVVVVGAGIAGMTMAYTLAQRGFSVRIFDERDPLGPGGVHAGHRAAALTPVVAADDNVRSRLSRAGAVAADQLWRQLPSDIGMNCGALQLEKAPDQRRRVDLEHVARTLDLPGWARWLTPEQASERAGLRLTRSALWLPGGWLVHVERLLAALAQAYHLSVNVAQVAGVRSHAGRWQVLDAQGDVLMQADAVVLANAADAPLLLQRSGVAAEQLEAGRLRSLHRLAGEITAIPATFLNQGPRCIVGGDGYVLPAVEGWCITGGTYVRGAEQAVVSLVGRQDNLARAGQLLASEDLLTRLENSGVALADLPGWAGWRAVVGGRLPVIGPVAGQANLYVCTAGASRGLTWSALQAQLVADHLEGHLPALESALLAQISMI